MFSKIFAVSLLSTFVAKAETIYSDIGVLEVKDVIADGNATELPPDLTTQGVNTTIQRMILDQHNFYRSLTALGTTPGYPSATNIESLVWDPALASVAQTYAEQCIWNHNSNRKAQFYATSGQSMWYDSTDIGVGENLYGFAPGSYDADAIVYGIGSWYKEYPNWSYNTGSYPGTCTTGTVCGHFTQLVWGNTRYVGCGVAYCPNGLTGWTTRSSSIVVCDYWPPGNYGGRTIYNKATDATKVGSDCNDRRGDTLVSGLCDGCYSSYGTQCAWNQYSTCSPEFCASDACLHCHKYCMYDGNSTCSSTCLLKKDTRDQCSDNLGRTVGQSTTTTTTKAPTPVTTTTTTTKSPTTTTTTTTTKAPTPQSTTTTTTTTTTTAASSTANSANIGTKCCAKNMDLELDVNSCSPLNTYRCSLTRKCIVC